MRIGNNRHHLTTAPLPTGGPKNDANIAHPSLGSGGAADRTGHDQDLTQGPIRQQLWSLAWPMMLSVFFYTLYNLVDAYWVSKLSAESIAAVSISQITLYVMISLGFGITVGSGVIMAMHIGAKDKNEAERVLGQSFVLAAIAGVFFHRILAVIQKGVFDSVGRGRSHF